jgi:hypothetical protein
MKNISTARNEIAEYWHQSRRWTKEVFASEDDFAAFYTSLFLIQDTSESVSSHMSVGFSDDPMKSYIEFWGVMQALIIQQDAIKELHSSCQNSTPQIEKNSAWLRIRELRNRCAGHPAKKTTGKAHFRSFMGRGPRSYDHLSYEEYNSETRTSQHPQINLGILIEEYDVEGARIVAASLEGLKIKMAQA